MKLVRLNALLNANGVLGINRRNAEYMLPHNRAPVIRWWTTRR